MIVGYARVSTDEQKLDLQIRALENVKCDKIFTDHGRSGLDFGRAGLDGALGSLKSGDTLIVWRLDRLGRSLPALVVLMDQLGKRGVNFHSLTENINTTSSGGRLMFHMMAALAEFERSLISERTRAGLSAARARGCTLGRPRSLSPHQIAEAFEAIREEKTQMQDIAEGLGVSVRTLRRSLRNALPAR
ncbi:DNA-invertase+hin [Methylocapsa aurea]|jgi:DNA invertase Pin-like site-specific DNA recombinase|uniref:recombinase family protein n=1 Tax=Methylocapsa aurea TaxID=663610 RepID=UPI003D189E39